MFIKDPINNVEWRDASSINANGYNPNVVFTPELKLLEKSILKCGWIQPVIINPDNICVTQNYVYIQEDGDSFWPEATHNSLIWQYNIATGSKKVFMDMTHGDANMLNSIYNPAGANQLKKGIWEHGAMEDISDVIGVPGTFTINVHAHTWIDGDKFLNPSKATSVQSYKSGGQTLIITNVPR